MQIKWGDTLSGIAQRTGTTVDALMKANSQIKDPNKIYAGDHLNIPGQKDEYVGPSGGPGGPSAPAPAGATGSVGPVPPGQVGDWIRHAMDVLRASGVPDSKMNPQAIATIIQHESGGNPNAQNNWDINAKNGTPSIGLMQTIQPTFDSYKLPGHDNIRNPVDNIIAGVRYAISRYGSVDNVPGVAGLRNGSGYVGY